MKKVLVTLIALLAVHISGASQTPYFQQYFLLKKNEPVQINTMYQDHKGFTWFGTSRGLFRLDGKKQRRFTSAQGLGNENITALAEDSLGRIWIGDAGGKISFLEKDTIRLFDPPEGSATASISDILFDRKGNLWFSTLDDGLYYFTSDRLYRVDAKEGMPDLYVYDLAEDELGNIWAGTDGGAAICKLNGSKVSIDVIDYNDGLPDNIIKKIIPENDSTIWLATEDEGIIRFNPLSSRHETLLKSGWEYGTITDFVIKRNKMWVSCPQKGLLVFDRSSNQIAMFTAEAMQGLSSIRVLMKDTEGNIWAGSKSGLLRTPGDDLAYLDNPNPAGNSNVLAVTGDNQGSIWFSTNEGLFKRKLNQPSGRIEKPLSNTSYRQFTVISLYCDAAGFVWAGLYGEGALRINPVTGRITYLNKELRNGNVLNITGNENNVWLATLGGGTQVKITGGEQISVTNYSSTDGLISDFIYQIFLDGNRVWFATDGKGLGMKDESGFHHYEKGLPSTVVYGIVKDGNQKLWVNVQGNGLYTFDGESFHPPDSGIVLRDNNIHSLSSDKSGNIVVMHDAGMDVIDVRKNKVRYLGEEVGIREKKANLNTVGKDKDGSIYLGTSGGIIKYAGESDYLDRKPKPEIESVMVFDEVIDSLSFAKLEYNENNITINYLGLWYQNPDGLFFLYRLENYDRDWIGTMNNSVTFSRLPPGTYSFRLKVSETDNFNDAQETTVRFTIHPPFWQTVTFYIFAAVAILVSVFGYIKSRERKLRRDNEILETTVRLRTAEIQSQNEEISAQSEEILRINENLEAMVQERTAELERKNKALEEYAFINAHKLRSPVATILGLVNLISKTKLDEEGTEINRRLKGTADELDDIVNSITKAIERGDKRVP